MFSYRKGAAVLLALTSFSAQSSTSATTQARLSYIEAMDLKELRFGDPPTLSPKTEILAYVISNRAAKASSSAAPKGTPNSAIGAKIHLSTAPEVPICGGTGNQWHPSWSNDGGQLAFYSDAAGAAHLWVLDVKNGNCKRLSEKLVRTSLLGGFQPIWAADDRTLFFPLPAAIDEELANAANSTEPGEHSALAPRVLRSGAEAPEGKSKPSGDEDERLRRFHHSAWAALDLRSGAVSVALSSEVIPLPAQASLSPSSKWMSYTTPQYSVKENSHKYAKDLVAVNLSTGQRTKLAALPLRGASYFWHPENDQLIYAFEGALWIAEPTPDGAIHSRRLEFPNRSLSGGLAILTRDSKHVLVRLSTTGADGNKGAYPNEFGLIGLDGRSSKRFAMPDPAQWQYSGAITTGGDVLWQPDLRYMHVRFRDANTGTQVVQRIRMDNGERTTVLSGQFDMTAVGASADHARVYMVYEDLATYPDVYRFDQTLRNKVRVSRADTRANLVEPPIAHKTKAIISTHDGRLQETESLLLVPRGRPPTDGFPTIVMTYPGANQTYSINQFGGGAGNSIPTHIFTSRGYAVLMTNVGMPRGDTPGNPIQVISDQVLPQVVAAVETGLVDIKRLALSGQSYGGYATMALLSHTNLFRAGIAVNGITDLSSHVYRLGKADDAYWIRWAEDGQGQMGNSLWSDPFRYTSNSPFYRLDRIQTPLLLLVGEKDSTVAKEESEKVFVGLRRLGKPAELAIYPDQGHVIQDWVPSSAGDAAKRAVEFLDRHLK